MSTWARTRWTLVGCGVVCESVGATCKSQRMKVDRWGGGDETFDQLLWVLHHHSSQSEDTIASSQGSSGLELGIIDWEREHKRCSVHQPEGYWQSAETWVLLFAPCHRPLEPDGSRCNFTSSWCVVQPLLLRSVDAVRCDLVFVRTAGCKPLFTFLHEDDGEEVWLGKNFPQWVFLKVRNDDLESSLHAARGPFVVVKVLLVKTN